GLAVPMPWISGGDVAGEVAEVGANVKGFKIGEKVMIDPLTNEGITGETLMGGLAQYCRVPQDYVIKLDPRVSMIQAASIAANYGTSFRMIVTNGQVQKNDLVLILGASGGVGTSSLQICKMLGARVIAAAGSDDKCK